MCYTNIGDTMKIDNRGFTLVELLATMAVLSIIMLITIPNVIGVVQKNKNKTFVEDAKKLVSMAKYEHNKVLNASNTTYYISTLDKNNELSQGPNGGNYTSNSRVVVNGNNYIVYLIEKKSNACNGITNVNEDNLFQDNATTLVKKVNCP